MTSRPYSELKDWSFQVEEVSAGVYRASGRDVLGRSVEAHGTDPDNLLERCRGAAKEISSSGLSASQMTGGTIIGKRVNTDSSMTICRCNEVSRLEGEEARHYAKTHLQELSVDSSKWIILLRCADTGHFWKEWFAQSEAQGGGPQVLDRISRAEAEHEFLVKLRA